MESFYQARVSITQIPFIKDQKEIIAQLTAKNNQVKLMEMSWLCNPFMNHEVYCAEVSLSEEFSWSFLFNGYTYNDALVKAQKFLEHLNEKFPGLDGEISVTLVKEEYLIERKEFYEISLPHPDYIKPISLFTKIIRIYWSKHRINILAYFFWQQTDAVDDYRNNQRFKISDYKFKVYFQLQDATKFRYILEYLVSDIANMSFESAKFLESPPDIWRNIMKMNVFWQNRLGERTGRFFNVVANKIPEALKFQIVVPWFLDFYLWEDIRLPSVHLPHSEIIHSLPFSTEDARYLHLGHIVKNGVVSSRPALLEIKELTKSMLIAGIPGVGKTRLIYQLSTELHEKAPQVGLLYLNLGKGGQEQFYRADVVLKYGDPAFRIPYFVIGQEREKAMAATASYIMASLGLMNPMDKLLDLVINLFFLRDGSLPPLQSLIEGLLDYLEKNPYHAKFQHSMVRALKNRISILAVESKLIDALELYPNLGPPDWLKKWFRGRSYYIDLYKCKDYTKWLLTNAILQAIVTLTPDMESPMLKNVVFIDEAHHITAKPKYQPYNDDKTIARGEMEKIFTTLLQEFRSKGLGFVLADQMPSNLYECVSNLPSLKILFHLGDECIEKFHKSPKEKAYLGSLRTRHAYFKNSSIGEEYEFRTNTIEE